MSLAPMTLRPPDYVLDRICREGLDAWRTSQLGGDTPQVAAFRNAVRELYDGLSAFRDTSLVVDLREELAEARQLQAVEADGDSGGV